MKNKIFLILIIYFVFILNTVPAFAKEPLQASLLQVLANPDKYNGQEIQLIGYLHLEFEGDGLWLHKEDYDNGIVLNTIWVDTNDEMVKQENILNNHYVIIKGTFDSKSHGYMGLFSGTLYNITRCEKWPHEIINKIKQKPQN